MQDSLRTRYGLHLSDEGLVACGYDPQHPDEASVESILRVAADMRLTTISVAAIAPLREHNPHFVRIGLDVDFLEVNLSLWTDTDVVFCRLKDHCCSRLCQLLISNSLLQGRMMEVHLFLE